MLIIIFILMYITGVMLSFADKSNFKGFNLNAFFRITMFLKAKKRLIYANSLVFQSLNIILFATVLLLYLFLNENEIATVYNIYKWITLIMFVSVMAVTAIDVIRLENNEKGNDDESN